MISVAPDSAANIEAYLSAASVDEEKSMGQSTLFKFMVVSSILAVRSAARGFVAATQIGKSVVGDLSVFGRRAGCGRSAIQANKYNTPGTANQAAASGGKMPTLQ
jgi:hypothetical protein